MHSLKRLTDVADADAFGDMCIAARTEETRKAVIDLERRVGFRRFCLNTEVDAIWTRRVGGKKSKEDRESPTPPVPPPQKPPERPLGQPLYSRLTFPLTDPIEINKMATPNILAYDVIAVEPSDEKLLHKICTESENVDLVTFNYSPGNVPGFKISHGIVKVGVERGIHFEICVSPGLRSSQNAKQNLISFARKIVNFTKGKNVILSLGAMKPNEVRGPYDLMNLGVLFGMNQSQAKDAMTRNFSNVLRHGLTRKSGGGIVTIERFASSIAKTKDGMADWRRIKKRIDEATTPSGNDQSENKVADSNEVGNVTKKSESAVQKDADEEEADVPENSKRKANDELNLDSKKQCVTPPPGV